jgi:hypothetical protein
MLISFYNWRHYYGKIYILSFHIPSELYLILIEVAFILPLSNIFF